VHPTSHDVAESLWFPWQFWVFEDFSSRLIALLICPTIYSVTVTGWHYNKWIFNQWMIYYNIICVDSTYFADVLLPAVVIVIWGFKYALVLGGSVSKIWGHYDIRNSETNSSHNLKDDWSRQSNLRYLRMNIWSPREAPNTHIMRPGWWSLPWSSWCGTSCSPEEHFHSSGDLRSRLLRTAHMVKGQRLFL